MMRVLGQLLANPNPSATLNAWPVSLSRDGTRYTLHIDTYAGGLLIDFEADQVKTLHHAITMLLNFPRMTNIAFPVNRPAKEEPQTPPLDIPLV